MTEDILINITPFETRVALVEQGSVQELHIERHIQRGYVGNLYLGKVSRVLPGMQSAFIDIGLERAAFIHVADLSQNRASKYNSEAPTPIEKLLFEGQSLIVQVIKDPLGTKGARVSTCLSIAGRMLVHLPYEPVVRVSQRIDNEEERHSLRDRVQNLIGPKEDCGFIIRTQAEGACDDELAADKAYLETLWKSVQSKAISIAAPAVLHTDLTLEQRVLRDMVTPQTANILVDSRTTTQTLTEWAQMYTPSVIDRIKHYSGARPLFDLANVDEEIQHALSRRVELKSGGYLIIDQTEALTTVDVNTGGFVGGRNFDDTIFKTNLEAAVALARQLRLRNIGGIIVIDFIDMDNAEHREAVLTALNQSLSKDRTRVTISGYSQLGLVELTRKRTRESLTNLLCEPCPACNSKGSVRTARTLCYEILREILREARQFNPREFRILASQAVVDLFLEEESQHLAMLEDFVGKPISLEVESQYFQEQYDIVLM